MRIDPDTCRDPDLLNVEVRRLRAVIAAGAPTLTDNEREAFAWGINWLFARFIMDDNPTARRDIKTLQQLFARLDVTNPMPIEISADVSSHPTSDRIYVSSKDSND